jgi:hypothetical protein
LGYGCNPDTRADNIEVFLVEGARPDATGCVARADYAAGGKAVTEMEIVRAFLLTLFKPIHNDSRIKLTVKL